MSKKSHIRFATYLEKLLASGKVAFSRADAEKELGIPRHSVLKSTRRLEKQGKLYSPRNGYYVLVPPQFFSWGRRRLPGLSTILCGLKAIPTTSGC